MSKPTSMDKMLKCAKEHNLAVEKLLACFRANIGNEVNATLSLKCKGRIKTNVKGIIKAVYKTYFTIDTKEKGIVTVMIHDVTIGKAKVNIV